MECLKGYIGIQGCGAPVPVPGEGETLDDVFSGMYINQLPGISLKSIEKLADQEQGNFLGVWADVERRALLKFDIAVRGKISKGYSINDKTVTSCLVCNNKILFAVALWYLMGTELMIERTSSDRLNRYTTIELDKAEKLKAEFFAEYQTSFDDALCSIDIQNSDCIEDTCIECNADLMFVESLP